MLLVFSQLLLKSLIDLHHRPPFLQDAVSLFKGKAKFTHHVAAEHGGTSRHAALAVHQNIFISLERVLDEGCDFLEERQYFDVHLVLHVYHQVPLCQAQRSDPFPEVFLLERFLIDDRQHCPDVLRIHELITHCFLPAQEHVPALEIIIFQSLVVRNRVCHVEDEIQFVSFGRFGLPLHIKELQLIPTDRYIT